MQNSFAMRLHLSINPITLPLHQQELHFHQIILNWCFTYNSKQSCLVTSWNPYAALQDNSGGVFWIFLNKRPGNLHGTVDSQLEDRGNFLIPFNASLNSNSMSFHFCFWYLSHCPIFTPEDRSSSILYHLQSRRKFIFETPIQDFGIGMSWWYSTLSSSQITEHITLPLQRTSI